MSRLQRWLRKLGYRAKKRRRSAYVEDHQRQQQLRYEEWQREYEAWRQAQDLSSVWPSLPNQTKSHQEVIMDEGDGFSDNFVCEDDRNARFSEPEGPMAESQANQQELRRRRRISSPEFSQVPQRSKAMSSGKSKDVKGHKRHRRHGETVSLSGTAKATSLPNALDYYTLSSVTNSWGMFPVVMKSNKIGHGGVEGEYIASPGLIRGEDTRPLLFLRSQATQKRAWSFTYGDLEEDDGDVELLSFKTVEAN